MQKEYERNWFHLALVNFCSGIQKRISIYLCNASCSSSCASSSSTIELLSVSAIWISETEQEEVLVNDREISLQAAKHHLIFTNTGGDNLQYHPRKVQNLKLHESYFKVPDEILEHCGRMTNVCKNIRRFSEDWSTFTNNYRILPKIHRSSLYRHR